MATFSRKSVTTLLVSILLGAAFGCSKQPNDEMIAKDVQDKVAADPVARDSNVSVTAKDGKVILKGTVKDSATQKRLEQIGREEPGVTGVDDETAVLQEPVPAPAQAANMPAPTPEQTTNIPAPAPQQAATAPVAAPQQANDMPAQAPAPPEEKPKPQPIIVPAGTALTVTVDQALSSKNSQDGQSFLATLAQPVTVHGKTAIPKGSSVTGTVITAKEKGKIKGEGQLSLALASITIRGKNYPIQTGALDSTVKGKGKRTAATTGGGAAGGALIGGLAGGGKGAGIGALVGGVGGLIGGAVTGNKQIEIPAETALTFTLSNPLTLPPRAE
jgi:BON domain